MAATDNTNRVAGTAILTIDGVQYALRGNFKYSVANIARETVTGEDIVHGYKEMPRPPFISCDITDSGGLTVASFNAQTNVTVEGQLANGKVVIGSGMWTVEPEEVESSDAKFSVKWEGGTGSVVELTA